MPPRRKYPLQVQRVASALRNDAIRRYIRRRRLARQLEVSRALRPKFGHLSGYISRYAR